MTTIPAGLILLVGPPASGKSTLARAWVGNGTLDPAGVLSCDAVRLELFGPGVRVDDDPAVFDAMDVRIRTRLADGLAVVVDATNVTPDSRARTIAWARERSRPVTALRFTVDEDVLLRRNGARTGPAVVPPADLLRYAAIARERGTRAELEAEGVDLVLDVPGESDGQDPRTAAASFRISRPEH